MLGAPTTILGAVFKTGILAGVSPRSLGCGEVAPLKEDEGQPKPHKERNSPALKCRWCLRVFSLGEWSPASLTMHHLLLLFLWSLQSTCCEDALDASAVALQGWGAGSILLLLTALAIAGSALRAVCKVWKRGSFSHCQELHLQDWRWLSYLGAPQNLILGMPQGATLIATLNLQGEWKLGDVLDFSAMDYKQMTKLYFSVWLAWLSLLLEAATLLFKKWTNLWRQRNKMHLTNYVLCRRSDQLGFGKCWL